MVTLKQIAAEAGVAISSVSDVLHRKDTRYSSTTRSRVRAVANRLGYRPNAIARTMVRGKSHSIGVVGHDLATPLNVERLQAISVAGKKRGYHMFLSGGEEIGRQQMQETIEELLARRVDGLIIFFMPDADPELFTSLQKRGVPFVPIGYLAKPTNLPLLSVDAEGGMYQATRHLLDLGHRDIVFAAGRMLGEANYGRAVGFRRAMRDAGVPVREDRLLNEPLISREAVRRFTESVLGRSDRPTAIMNVNDEMALVCMHTIHQMGLRVPQDVSVTGFDDLPIAQFVWPELTTVHQPRAELGQLAVKILLDQIDGVKTDALKPVLMKSELIVRGSTGVVGASQ